SPIATRSASPNCPARSAPRRQRHSVRPRPRDRRRRSRRKVPSRRSTMSRPRRPRLAARADGRDLHCVLVLSAWDGPAAAALQSGHEVLPLPGEIQRTDWFVARLTSVVFEVRSMAKRLPRHFNCPTEFTLAVLGGKWKTVILCYLKERSCRY